ncbi:hypothetical protein TrST_g1366 [Triparma strigata]|uniref:GIY-YIG domain-containing protein n=1 Tax=Triparma strigata TaxID=1606541 RepID=A0A9W7BMH7_9STRA|nr:hypothetical protein TrST_g1366 [Triparma strigata]
MKSCCAVLFMLLLLRRTTGFSASFSSSSLSRRLENIKDLVLDNVPPTNTLVDVCSDHALLPIHVHASPHNPFEKSIAIDLSANACSGASATLQSLPLPHPPITVLEGDGLLPLMNPDPTSTSTPRTYTVVIAGVGVNTILDILSPLQTESIPPHPQTFPKLIISPTKTRSRNLLKIFNESPVLKAHYGLKQVKVNIERNRWYFAFEFHAKSTSSPPPPPPPQQGYIVYCLKSTTSSRTYIGSTNDLKRRLRQHNGELAGGAKSTHSGRPWIVGTTVSGFGTSRSAATSFESSWKNQDPVSKRGYENRIEKLSTTLANNSPPGLTLTQTDHINITNSDKIEELLTPFIDPTDAESLQAFSNYLEFDRKWEMLDQNRIDDD